MAPRPAPGWLERVEIGDDSDQLTARATLDGHSRFFDGHFPGQPVVPGIALVGMVEAALRARFPGARLAGLRRVKFRQMADQGGAFDVAIALPAPGTTRADLRFEVRLEGQVLADGVARVEGLTR